ncbi:insecticidal toxin complex protein TccC [Pseudomonas syringae]|uniref:RHS repeat domain-containing protein n=1 Tax=Pseudomonas syringae TaxID=317 RepID=UPI000896E0F8|nr:RHS repeat-associated core domain-containing protein [Pseudomonas syringae]SDW24775.1 insecticidal toxin complex protein TccC [Pseudomonas syringae]SFL54270.1 insecticidal toxin complex protein TccC [Pseudomonas syringae]
MFSSALHAQTPELAVADSRGLTVRHVLLHRTEVTEVAVARVTGQRFDPAGRMIAAIDSRLDRANRSTVYSLSGSALFTESVDAGWRLALFGEGGQILADWDGRGSERKVEYDALLRPEKIVEQKRVVEVFAYGGVNADGHNQCNQLIRHDDHAGTLFFDDYGLHGSALSETRHFTLATGQPDWSPAEPDRTAMLEPIGLQTRWAFNASGDVVEQTDAKSNRQVFDQTVDGQLKETVLTLAGGAQQQTLASEIHYNAFNQIEQETAGNGVVSRYSYNQQDGRLDKLSAVSAQGSALQRLFYSYDPVGNILRLEDASQMDKYCDNQCIEPISRYTYDTLYQLIETTGREVRNGASHGPALPDLQPLPTVDPCQVSNYKQRYQYDAAGNLLLMRHEGAQDFTRKMHVAPDSNRSLPDGNRDADFDMNFDANGNLLQLVRGQVMSWDVRNQLQTIITVQRKDGPNDEERYIYDGQGQRCRKISTSQASGRTLINEARDLPGLEIRTTADGEILHVITAQAGRNSVRILHWEAGKPDGIANDQVRYSLSDHLGSSTLELDHRGSIISHESYYPFGGTAWWAARSAVEAKYKTVRYSGKERDASGLYYYGFRYYAPWLQRWINPDPAGDVDGLNLFQFIANSPINYRDASGLQKYKSKYDRVELEVRLSRGPILRRGLTDLRENSSDAAGKLRTAIDYAVTATAEAIEALENPPSANYSTLARRILGDENPDHDLLLTNFRTLHAAAIKYQNKNAEQLVVVKSKIPTELAFVVKGDPHERIFFTEAGLKQPKKIMAMTFIHELSHIKLKTGDFYYYQKGYTTNPNNQESPDEAHDVGAGLHDERLVTTAQKNVSKKMLRSLFGSSNTGDFKTKLQTDKTLRSNALLRNADTWALLIFSHAHSALWRMDLREQGRK